MSHLHVVDLQTKASRRLTSGSFTVGRYSWSPDSARLVFDHRIKEGLADPNRVGAMGWSQGGYISAFLTTHDSARFKAISVGAGISDWMTKLREPKLHGHSSD